MSMRVIGGDIISLKISGPVLSALKTWVGQIIDNAIAHDALVAFLEAEGGLARSLKPVERLLRNDDAVIAASLWLNGLANKLGISREEALRLVAAIRSTDAISDDIIVIVRPRPDLMDAEKLSSLMMNEDEIDLRELPGIGAYIACPRKSTLPLVAGVDANPDNTPRELLDLARKLGRRTRQKGLFGTDRIYIRVRRLGGHCDPSLVIVPERTVVIVYGDWLNGLATVIKALVSGKARQMIFYDFQ